MSLLLVVLTSVTLEAGAGKVSKPAIALPACSIFSIVPNPTAAVVRRPPAGSIVDGRSLGNPLRNASASTAGALTRALTQAHKSPLPAEVRMSWPSAPNADTVALIG